jgi:hypothetical protein
LGHYVSGCRPAGASTATTDLLDDIRLGDDTHHRPSTITDDNKADLRVREQFRDVHEQRIDADRHQPRMCDGIYAAYKLRIHLVSFRARYAPSGESLGKYSRNSQMAATKDRRYGLSVE